MNALSCTESHIATVAGDLTVRLPLGLLGFENIQQYSLIADPEEAPFRWLQVQDESHLAFLVLSPFEVNPDYELQLGDEDAQFLGLNSAQDALVFNIVTLRPKGSSTINLRGPIVLNRHTLVGKQVVLPESSGYSLHHPLPQAAE
jgi:flagellar assembly factor FliW